MREIFTLKSAVILFIFYLCVNIFSPSKMSTP